MYIRMGINRKVKLKKKRLEKHDTKE